MVVGPIEVTGTAFVDVARWDREQEVKDKYAPGKRRGLSRRDFELFGCIARTLSNPNNRTSRCRTCGPLLEEGQKRLVDSTLPEEMLEDHSWSQDKGVRSLRQADLDGRWSASTGTDNHLGVDGRSPSSSWARERMTNNPPNAQRLRRWPELTQRE